MNINKPVSILTSTLQIIIAGIFSGLLVTFLLCLIVMLISNNAGAQFPDETIRVYSLQRFQPGEIIYDILLLVGFTRYIYVTLNKLSVLLILIAFPFCGVWHMGKLACIHIKAILAHSSLRRLRLTNSSAKWR